MNKSNYYSAGYAGVRIQSAASNTEMYAEESNTSKTEPGLD